MRSERSWSGLARCCGRCPLCVTAEVVGDLCGDTEPRASRLESQCKSMASQDIGSLRRNRKGTTPRRDRRLTGALSQSGRPRWR